MHFGLAVYGEDSAHGCSCVYLSVDTFVSYVTNKTLHGSCMLFRVYEVSLSFQRVRHVSDGSWSELEWLAPPFSRILSNPTMIFPLDKL